MVKRIEEIRLISNVLKQYPVAGLIGARQVGKTTLARQFAKYVKMPVTFFDLEDPQDIARLQDPMLALKDLKGLVIIDEIQTFPDLFRVIRVLADRPRKISRFLILGSASPHLIKKSSQSLAGRIFYHKLSGFSLEEIGPSHLNQLWLKGTFPRSFLAPTLTASYQWRGQFIKTYLERDIPQLGIRISSYTLRRFWNMLAHWHGQVWNASEFGRSFGVADTTVRGYLDLLSDTFVVRQLRPWHENISRRQVKSPKIFITDSGILHTLLQIKTHSDLLNHPKVGASWEGFAIEQLITLLGVEENECYFWATHSGAELDLLIVKGRTKTGFEIKFTSSPRVTPSMKSALSALQLNKLYVVYPGEENYKLGSKIFAVSLKKISKVFKNRTLG